MSIEEIKDHMISYILANVKNTKSVPTARNRNEYDEDGYCSNLLWNKILNFWKNFEEKDFEYLVSGKWATDGLDLEGGRSYLLSNQTLRNMVFDYMFFTLNWDKNQYEKILYNSTDLSDFILDIYDSDEITKIQSRDKIIGEIFT